MRDFLCLSDANLCLLGEAKNENGQRFFELGSWITPLRRRGEWILIADRPKVKPPLGF